MPNACRYAHCMGYAGDTGLLGDMKLIGESVSVDLALLPIGGRYVMDIMDAAIAADWLRAREKITSHFQRPFIPLSGVAKTRNMPDISAFSRLADRATDH